MQAKSELSEQRSLIAVCVTGGAALESLAARHLARESQGRHESLTESELAICSAMGIDAETFKKTKADASADQNYGLSTQELAVCKSVGVSPRDFARAKAA